jgi:cytochrome c-type biogenesis protein CcmH/NrfG
MSHDSTPSTPDDIIAEACQLVEQNRLRQVTVYLKKAVHSDPQDLEGLMALAGVFRNLNRRSEALILLEALEEFHPANPALLQLRADILKELEHTPDPPVKPFWH